MLKRNRCVGKLSIYSVVALRWVTECRGDKKIKSPFIGDEAELKHHVCSFWPQYKGGCRNSIERGGFCKLNLDI